MMKLIVGLGNPETSTKPHNVGFMVVDRLAEEAVGSKFEALILKSRSCLLVSLTFMNQSRRGGRKIIIFIKLK